MLRVTGARWRAVRVERCLMRSITTAEQTSDWSTSSSDSDEEVDREWRGRPSWPGFSYKQVDMDQLYPGHIPTTALQKLLLGIGTGVTAFFYPARDDMIAYFGESTGYIAVRYMREKMRADSVGRQILKERPRINSSTINLDELRQMPEGTLGHAYIKFLEKNNVTPDSRRCVSYIDDEELAYVMQRYREVHDLNHTVLGMRTNMLGEVVVKWYEGLQTGLPLGLLGAMFSPLRFGPVYRRRYLETYWSWSIKAGLQAKFFMNVYFERHFNQDLRELRRRWNIPEPPDIVK